MLKNHLLFCFIILTHSVFSQTYFIEQANKLYDNKKYSSAQALYGQIIIDIGDCEEAEYYYAKCSKELFQLNSENLYLDFLNKYPIGPFSNKAKEDLGLIYFREKSYLEAIEFIKNVDDLFSHNYLVFKLAYANFCIDSLEEASYYFSKLMNVKSKYASSSRYYFSYIAYKNHLYETALTNFTLLIEDDKFGKIVPYYIAQIYYIQKKYKLLISYLEPMISDIIPSRESEIYKLLAESHFQIGDFKNSIKYFNLYIDRDIKLSSSVRFMLGKAYFEVGNYEEAVFNFEKVINVSDSLLQLSTYYLAGAYLKKGNYNYALQAFKKASQYDEISSIQEDAFFNYAKLAYELDLPFDNTLIVLNSYLDLYNNVKNRKEIESLMLETLRGTKRYKEAYKSLNKIPNPNDNQKNIIQQLSFFLGVQSYNNHNYRQAIKYFNKSLIFPEDNNIQFLSSFWLSDCYFQLTNYKKAVSIYKSCKKINTNLNYYNNLYNYNLAYCYFMQEDYEESNKYFRIYVSNSKDSMRLNDSYLRIADGLYMKNKYILAGEYYQKAILYGLFDVDYATYQRSIVLGLLGKNSEKLELLNKFVDEFSNSIYYDNSLFDLANLYSSKNNLQKAMKYFDLLLEKTKDVNLITETKMSIAMLHLKNNNLDDAISSFMFIVDNHYTMPCFKEALAGLKTIYISLGDVDTYVDLIANLPDYSITKAEQDSLTYTAGFIKFSDQEYEIAKSTFDNYINSFPDGIFINDALYYNALICEKIGDSLSAFNLYNSIVQSGKITYREPSLTYIARKYYKNKDYTKSNQYYSLLEEISSSNSLKRESIVRLMYGYSFLKNDLSFTYANKVLLLDKVDDWLLNKTNLIIGKYHYNNGNYVKARKVLQLIDNYSEYDEGAEAKYYLIYLTYLDDSLDLAENMIFDLVEMCSNDYFIAKSFILLSDIYQQKNNYFQAKATLESIIDNYDGEELVNIARKKWEKIIESEMVEKQNSVEKFLILDNDLSDDIEFELDVIQIIDTNYQVIYSDSLIDFKTIDD